MTTMACQHYGERIGEPLICSDCEKEFIEDRKVQQMEGELCLVGFNEKQSKLLTKYFRSVGVDAENIF